MNATTKYSPETQAILDRRAARVATIRANPPGPVFVALVKLGAEHPELTNQVDFAIGTLTALTHPRTPAQIVSEYDTVRARVAAKFPELVAGHTDLVVEALRAFV